MMPPTESSLRLKIEFAQHSDPGRDPNKQVNEDACGYAETQLGHLCVLCDGMGGHYGGSEASRTAIKTIFEVIEQTPATAAPGAALKAAIEEAGRRVYRLGGQAENRVRPGSTAVAMLLHDAGVDVAHVGDSRAYVIRAHQIYPLTRDHSMVQGMIDAGMITEAQAIGHPDANKITRALGMKPEVEVEVRPEPMELYPGDVLILASDGLTDLVLSADILGCTRQALASGSVDHACKMLVHLANSRGGYDNITVQMARVIEAGNRSQTIAHAPPGVAGDSGGGEAQRTSGPLETVAMTRPDEAAVSQRGPAKAPPGHSHGALAVAGAAGAPAAAPAPAAGAPWAPVPPTATDAPAGVRPTATDAPAGVRPTATDAPAGVRPTATDAPTEVSPPALAGAAAAGPAAPGSAPAARAAAGGSAAAAGAETRSSAPGLTATADDSAPGLAATADDAPAVTATVNDIAPVVAPTAIDGTLALTPTATDNVPVVTAAAIPGAPALRPTAVDAARIQPLTVPGAPVPAPAPYPIAPDAPAVLSPLPLSAPAVSTPHPIAHGPAPHAAAGIPPHAGAPGAPPPLGAAPHPGAQAAPPFAGAHGALPYPGSHGAPAYPGSHGAPPYPGSHGAPPYPGSHGAPPYPAAHGAPPHAGPAFGALAPPAGPDAPGAAAIPAHAQAYAATGPRAGHVHEPSPGLAGPPSTSTTTLPSTLRSPRAGLVLLIAGVSVVVVVLLAVLLWNLTSG
ncbi:phosphoprotein phosphatase [Sorangium cellulosum]|uniref:Phosphoprotein phosphatase n=1 Tax=Sorangium cellulosum TaxID=56 RepID=A0A2L0EQ82_SORCE|nr:protein phosphatase 2C domain-containing protein [Sorangium cellulosum]AUX41435.1 phosphoprotein phosphatase [Sorangium cellulosum]